MEYLSKYVFFVGNSIFEAEINAIFIIIILFIAKILNLPEILNEIFNFYRNLAI